MITPTVTPAPPTPVHLRGLYPSREPLTSAGGPHAAVLKLVVDALASPSAAGLLPVDLTVAAFGDAMRDALADPKIIDAPTAARLASGVRALLVAWPASEKKHFALLYMTRLLVAASFATAAAVLDADMPAVLLAPNGGVLGGELDSTDTPLPAARGARLMALAVLANVAACPDGANRLLGGADGPEGRGASVVQAAARALCATSDGAVGQMGGALSLNLSLALTGEARADAASELRPQLLTAALRTLCALDEAPAADAEHLGRTLSVVGHLLSPGADGEDDEAVAVALSLDAPSALERLRQKATAAGHSSLLDRVAQQLQ